MHATGDGGFRAGGVDFSALAPPLAQRGRGRAARRRGLAWIERMRHDGLLSVAPTRQATDDYYAAVKAALPGTVWATGCDSWYLAQDGDPELWPWSPARHRTMLAEPDAGAFVVTARR